MATKKVNYSNTRQLLCLNKVIGQIMLLFLNGISIFKYCTLLPHYNAVFGIQPYIRGIAEIAL